MSFAFSSVIPLDFLVSYNNFTYSSNFSQVRGSTTLTPSKSTSSHPAPSIIFSSLPTIIILAIPSLIIFDAAINVRLSFVSGKTIVFLSIRAFSLIRSIYAISSPPISSMYIFSYPHLSISIKQYSHRNNIFSQLFCSKLYTTVSLNTFLFFRKIYFFFIKNLVNYF